MSWLFSQALVVEYLGGTSLGGAQSALWNATLMPQAYLCSDKTTEFSRLSRYGMTLQHLTVNHGEDLLMWFRVDSRVRTFPLLVEGQELTVSDQGCGEKWPASFVKYDLATCSWKTHQPSHVGGLDEFLVTWPRWGLMRDGECWAQSTQVRRTSETGSGLWPTPTVCGNYNRKGASKTSGDGLATAVKNWATPTARDWKSGKASQATMERNSRPLSEQVGGSLNPPWVEWLMGWPIGWTDLKPLEMGKFRQWQRWHLEN
jgi:hypothetical protein